MAKASRDKGKRSEAEFEKLIVARVGITPIREQDGRTQGADLRIGGYCIDVKRREKLSLSQWSRETEAKIVQPLIPCIAYRMNREPWRVSMLATDFLDVIAFTEGL